MQRKCNHSNILQQHSLCRKKYTFQAHCIPVQDQGSREFQAFIKITTGKQICSRIEHCGLASLKNEYTEVKRKLGVVGLEASFLAGMT